MFLVLMKSEAMAHGTAIVKNVNNRHSINFTRIFYKNFVRKIVKNSQSKLKPSLINNF